MSQFLQQHIKFLSGIGPQKAEMLEKELGIYTVEDLLFTYPYKHIDRSRIYKIAEIESDLAHIQLQGKIISIKKVGSGRKERLTAVLKDETGYIELVWFKGIKFISSKLSPDMEYMVFGKPSIFNKQLSMSHPEMESMINFRKKKTIKFQPLYHTTEKLKSKYINSKFIQNVVATILGKADLQVPEFLPESLKRKFALVSLDEAIREIHFPTRPEKLQKAQIRLKFQELFLIQMNILKSKYQQQKRIKGHVFGKVGDALNRFYESKLAFDLTEAQKRVIKEIRSDMRHGRQMNRLLQGDVGSGKTIVALMSMLIAIDNGFQACLMAPTEILATQHYEGLKPLLEGLPVEVRLLKGATKKAERTKIHEGLVEGNINILIGTHALIEDTVQFENLGLAIIDEQHRFGVRQRAKMWEKNTTPPHILVMTATPIPRTLAMTLYGDLDVSVIDELPPGRKPIQTVHYTESKRLRMFGFIKKSIDEGRQVYFVYPLIEESKKLDYSFLMDGYEALVRAFPPPKYQVMHVHGKMKNEEKDFAMKQFVSGKSQILVATTVIEVGVNVPNASVMIIESAERFGLSQLHQLRGRVGRGDYQSYCVLMTGHKLSKEAKQRMEIMVRSNDGFEIAEADLKLRGPGDLEGTQQSGTPFDLQIASITKDGKILSVARDAAMDLLDHDPELLQDDHASLKQKLDRNKFSQVDWGTIS